MTNNEIMSHIDHTQLKAVSTKADIDALCIEAEKFGLIIALMRKLRSS